MSSLKELNSQNYDLSPDTLSQVEASFQDWQKDDKVRRLWARDASLWTGSDEGKWLAWLGIVEDQLAHRRRLLDIAAEAKSGGFTHALLLGMGGSSLCPEVMRMTFGKIDGYPELHVLILPIPLRFSRSKRKWTWPGLYL